MRLGGPVVPLVNMRTAIPGRSVGTVASPAGGITATGAPRSSTAMVTARVAPFIYAKSSAARSSDEPMRMPRSRPATSSRVRCAPRPGLIDTTHPPAHNTPSSAPTMPGRVRNNTPTSTPAPGSPPASRTASRTASTVAVSSPQEYQRPSNSMALASESTRNTASMRCAIIESVAWFWAVGSPSPRPCRPGCRPGCR